MVDSPEIVKETPMSYTQSWLVPDRVIAVTAPKICDDTFIMRFNADMMGLLEATAAPVSLVIDVRNVVSYPSSQAFFNLCYLKHRHFDRLVTIGMARNPALRFMGSLMGQRLPIPVSDF